MGVAYNSRIITDGLVLCLDAANQKGISPLGNEKFNSASQLVKNLVSTSDTISSPNGVKLGNLSYYTIFAIDYPEGSYGGDGANRQGITPGFNVTSGAKIFGFGRALNYAVYNNPTQSWVKTTVYDSYVGSGPVDTFVSEYATAVATYPDAIHIVAGSHRDSFHTTAQYNILRDLGAPSNVDSIIGFSSPEWILVGKPGLGAGNAFGWVFQNYETNPSQVAHLNVGLPIYGTKDNYLDFDGSNEYIDVGNLGSGFNNFTVEIWFKSDSVTNYKNPIDCNWLIEFPGSYSNIGPRLEQNSSGSLSWLVGSGSDVYTAINVVSSGLDVSKYHYAAITKSSSTLFTTYYNGNAVTSTNFSNWPGSMSNVTLGRGFSTSSERWFNGRIPNAKIYNRALTAAEIQQNFNALRGRFGI